LGIAYPKAAAGHTYTMKFPLPFASPSDLIHVVVETPRGCSLKYIYDPEHDAFTVKKMLPAGLRFPLDFGFVPHTLAPDGDPLDALVLMEEPAYPGILMRCRLAGIIRAEQQDAPQGPVFRNDRLLCVAEASRQYAHIRQAEELDADWLSQILAFFIHYHRLEGHTFRPLGIGGPEEAAAMVGQYMVR
jgi:inorganic pyrophosphatase